jgi:hypothetical protein
LELGSLSKDSFGRFSDLNGRQYKKERKMMFPNFSIRAAYEAGATVYDRNLAL